MISVIVPVYKTEKYLDRCVYSIVVQTYSDYELILVDDGSPDNSGTMCDDWARKDKRIKVIHKSNGGLSSARNAGLDVATGEYVTFIDSDDVIHPEYLMYLHALCETNEADIALGRLKRFSTDEVEHFEYESDQNTTLRTGIETLDCFFENEKEVSNYVSACCKLYRRELFDSIRFPVGRLFEDEFTTYKVYYRASKIVDSERVLYYYYVNDNSITRNLTLTKRCDEYDAQYGRIVFFSQNEMNSLHKQAVMRYLSTAQWDMIEGNRLPKDKRNDRISSFQAQYRSVLQLAEKCKYVRFLDQYDYYVISYPKRVLLYRVIRQILMRKRK